MECSLSIIAFELKLISFVKITFPLYFFAVFNSNSMFHLLNLNICFYNPPLTIKVRLIFSIPLIAETASISDTKSIYSMLLKIFF